MGRSGLPDDRGGLVDAVSAWTSRMDKNDVAELLQRAGVPAAPMNRAVDVLADPVLLHRKLFTDMVHPLFDHPMPTETSPAPYTHIPRAELRPAPMPGEHTREICQKLLALDTEEIDRLIADGVLFTSADTPTHRRPIMTTPRTPVLVGYGQVNQRDEDPSVEPIELMAAAARAAADPRVLEAVDSIRIVNILSWRYRDPGLLLAQRIRAERRRHAATPEWAAMCRRRWSTRHAWTSSPGEPT